MHNQLSKLMAEDIEYMFWKIDADEPYVGNKRRATTPGRPGKDSHKTRVFCIVERGGKIAALVTPDAQQATVIPLIHERGVREKGHERWPMP